MSNRVALAKHDHQTCLQQQLVIRRARIEALRLNAIPGGSDTHKQKGKLLVHMRVLGHEARDWRHAEDLFE